MCAVYLIALCLYRFDRVQTFTKDLVLNLIMLFLKLFIFYPLSMLTFSNLIYHCNLPFPFYMLDKFYRHGENTMEVRLQYIIS
jgi:hypothetical protein